MLNYSQLQILDKEKICKQNMGNQIKKEISIMKSVEHPNVVAIREVFATSTKIFIVLELVDGGELFEYLLDKKRLAEEEARHFLGQILDGLMYCHSKGIFHRDLKPENLLLDLQGNVKISDFGLSTLYVGGADGGGEGDDRVELLHTTCGTPNYVAPEVLENRGYDGRQADVWSIGIVLFVLVAGYLPFEEDTMPALFDKIKRAEFSMPDCIDGSHTPTRSKNPYARSRSTPSSVISPTQSPSRAPSSVTFSRELIELLNNILVADPQRRWTLQQVRDSQWMQGHSERPSHVSNRTELAATPDRVRQKDHCASDDVKPAQRDENASPNTREKKSEKIIGRKSSNPLHVLTDSSAAVALPLPPALACAGEMVEGKEENSILLPPPIPQETHEICNVTIPNSSTNVDAKAEYHMTYTSLDAESTRMSPDMACCVMQ